MGLDTRGLLDTESGSSCRVLGAGGVRNPRLGYLAGGFISISRGSAADPAVVTPLQPCRRGTKIEMIVRVVRRLEEEDRHVDPSG